jgi:hypothetical protein
VFTWWQTALIAVFSGGLGALVTWWNGKEQRRQERELAALTDSKRREATQEAWTHYSKVRHLAGMGDREAFWAAYSEAQEWYAHNCLYLAKDARDATREGLGCAWMHWKLLSLGIRDNKPRKENWEQLLECGSVIEASMDRFLAQKA